MSNVREHPDWWLGEDGRWYPPPLPYAPADRCPDGHATRPGSRFCGACGQPLGTPPRVAATYASAGPVAGSGPLSGPVVPRTAAPHGDTHRPAVPARARSTRPKSPVAYVICLGAIVIGVAPLLRWVISSQDAGVSVSLFHAGSWGLLVCVISYALAVLALILPLTQVRPGRAGAFVAVAAVLGAAGTVASSYRMYEAWNRTLQAAQEGQAHGGSGVYVAAAGFLLVIVAGVVYAFSGRAERIRD